MNTHIVEQEISINAPLDKVWEKLTNPDETEKYFFKTRVHSTWHEGDPISFSRRILGLFTFKLEGIIQKIEQEKVLQYKLMNHTWFGKAAANEFSLVSIQLAPDADGTKVSVSDNVGEYSGAERRYRRSVTGWQKILHGLKRVSEEV